MSCFTKFSACQNYLLYGIMQEHMSTKSGAIYAMLSNVNLDPMPSSCINVIGKGSLTCCTHDLHMAIASQCYILSQREKGTSNIYLISGKESKFFADMHLKMALASR